MKIEYDDNDFYILNKGIGNAFDFASIPKQPEQTSSRLYIGGEGLESCISIHLSDKPLSSSPNGIKIVSLEALSLENKDSEERVLGEERELIVNSTYPSCGSQNESKEFLMCGTKEDPATVHANNGHNLTLVQCLVPTTISINNGVLNLASNSDDAPINVILYPHGVSTLNVIFEEKPYKLTNTLPWIGINATGCTSIMNLTDIKNFVTLCIGGNNVADTANNSAPLDFEGVFTTLCNLRGFRKLPTLEASAFTEQNGLEAIQTFFFKFFPIIKRISNCINPFLGLPEDILKYIMSFLEPEDLGVHLVKTITDGEEAILPTGESPSVNDNE